MAKEYQQSEKNSSQINDDGPDSPWTWEPQEIAQLEEALQKSHTERFRLLMRMMRIGNMLSRAKVTHQKID